MPIKKPFLFILTINILFSFSSIAQNETSPGLRSYGPVPDIITENYIPNYFFKVENKRRIATTTISRDRVRIVSELVSSGFLVFGNENVDYCQEIMDKLTKANQLKKKSVYLFKSSAVKTFHLDQNSICVTTGLIAQISNEDELAFFLSRELYLTEVNFEIERHVMYIDDFNDMILFLNAFQPDFALIDEAGLKILINAGYNGNCVNNSLDAIKYAELPFDEKQIQLDYFDTEQLKIPEQLLTINRSMNMMDDTPPFLVDREEIIKNLKKYLSPFYDSLNNEYTKSYDFVLLKEICQLEQIRLHIAECNHYQALYDIFLLEGNKSNTELPRLKALAWLGVIDQEHGKITTRKIRPYFGTRSQSAEFLLFLNLLNSDALSVVALRQLEKLRSENTSDPFFKMMVTKCCSILNSSEYFDISKFSTKSMKELEVENYYDSTKVEMDKYDKLNKPQNRFEIKPEEFYLYGLSDFITSGQLVKNKPTSLETIDNIQYKKNLGVNRYKKRHVYSHERSLSTAQKIENADLGEELTTDTYLFQSNFALTAYQLMKSSEYHEGLIPINYKFYMENESMEIQQFDGEFRMKYKPVYFIGLTGVGLLYVLPDLFIGSFNSYHTFFRSDNKTGEIITSEQDYYKDPTTKYNIEKRTELIIHEK